MSPFSLTKRPWEAVPRAVWRSMKAMPLNNGTQPSFSEGELKKLIESNERITRKEIAEYFGVSPRIIQRYMNLVKSVRYVGSGKSVRWEIRQCYNCSV